MVSRRNIKIDATTKRALDEVKRDAETWDDCLRRLVELDRATRVQDGDGHE
jgi:Arc/MetJ family transcription regulator